ncbi:hypothetical protein ALP58_01892, partial [Pseudomonas savastanoi]
QSFPKAVPGASRAGPQAAAQPPHQAEDPKVRTKIHALLDTTGSPIYDGRVGAAIALLYHLYRQGTGTTAPQALDFAWGPGIRFETHKT